MHRLLPLVLICMVTLSCTPPKPEITLDATTKEGYEKSLIQMSSGLASNERTALSEAIKVIQTGTQGISQVNEEANDRIKVAGKNRLQIIDEAKSIVLEYFEIYDELKKNIHVTVKQKPNGNILNNADVKVINNSRWDIQLTGCRVEAPDNSGRGVDITIIGTVKAGELAYLEGSSWDEPFKENQESTQFDLLILGRIPNSGKLGEQRVRNEEFDQWSIGDQSAFSVHPLYNSFLQHIDHARKSKM